MQQQVHLADRAAFSDAAALIDAFGEHAASEAAERARKSRDLGNFIHFCRWRQIERLIALLADDTVAGTVH